MDRLDIPAGSFKVGQRTFRFRKRLPGLDEEQIAAEAPTGGRREGDLSGYVPSPLIPTDKRMLALTIGGAPAWSRRLRRIDALTDAALAELEGSWRALARASGGRAAVFAAAWREHAARFDFRTINELIRRHNLYFPAEANLAMDVRTGDFVGLGGGDFRRPALDAGWVLDRFPPELGLALRTKC